ncbi:hypothetical protein psal_cds_831 [Pandoravirus salinus]|uniref:F-box incomplete domain containing protein n=1 Tax=Pandoravirus salinus TaxID=1349410 RepID=S4VZD5_9VIRU|nr:hypothetical protein psal_cds_831 [Pandoravirus salinus]AGO84871.1 hypothetical protein psal_cds_831 [Pandoravirus salinus]
MASIEDLPLDVLDLLLNGDGRLMPALDSRYRSTGRLVSHRWRMVIESTGHGAKKALAVAKPAGADAAAWMAGRLVCASTLVDRIAGTHDVDGINAVTEIFLKAWAPAVSAMCVVSVLALLAPWPPHWNPPVSPFTMVATRHIDRQVADCALDRICARTSAAGPAGTHEAKPSWRRILCAGVFAAIEADCSEAAAAFLHRVSRALTHDPLLPADDADIFLEDHIGTPLWDHVAARGSVRTAIGLLDLVNGAPLPSAHERDSWEGVLRTISRVYRRGAWVAVAARTNDFVVYDACAARQPFTVSVQPAAHYASIALLQRLPAHVGQSIAIIAGILDGPSARPTAAAALDWLATERVFVPTHAQAEHLFGTRPWLSGGRRRLSLFLARWPHLVEVACQYSHHMVDSILDALAAEDVKEAECLMEVLHPYVPYPDHGLWAGILARLHEAGHRQIADLRVACSLAAQRDASPTWRAWCGDMIEPINKTRVLACTSRIGPGAMDARAKAQLGDLFACLAGYGLLIEHTFSDCDTASHTHPVK